MQPRIDTPCHPDMCGDISLACPRVMDEAARTVTPFRVHQGWMRAITLALVVVVLAAAGCTGRGDVTPPPPPTPTTVTPPTPEEAPTPAPPTRSEASAGNSNDWPTNDSFVGYSAQAAWATPEGERRTWTNATWRFRDDAWDMSCDGAQVVRPPPGEGNASRQPISSFGRGEERADLPPHIAEGMKAAPPEPATRLGWTLHDCRLLPAEIVGDGSDVSLDLGGQPVRAILGNGPGARVWWDERTGLVLAWEVEEGGLTWRGALVSTDARLARG